MDLTTKTDPVIQVIDDGSIVVMAWSSVKQKYVECSRRKMRDDT
jgi:hypothetical protein